MQVSAMKGLKLNFKIHCISYPGTLVDVAVPIQIATIYCHIMIILCKYLTEIHSIPRGPKVFIHLITSIFLSWSEPQFSLCKEEMITIFLPCSCHHIFCFLTEYLSAQWNLNLNHCYDILLLSAVPEKC